MTKSILDLDVKNYNKHSLHSNEKIWAETNCYTDLVIEILHSYQFEPCYALAFTLALDFEGDQWGFFKFHFIDLFDLYGIEIDEFNLWRPLVVHIESQIAFKRICLVELDSFYLPDTKGTAYQLLHTKTTVGINKFDLKNKKAEYFHNQGYYEIEGSDFDNAFQVNGRPHDRVLPPYFEIMKINNKKEKTEEELLNLSLLSLKKHLNRVSQVNPFEKFKAKLIEDLKWFKNSDIESFHLYSFANLRQFGSCFELTGLYLKFLNEKGIKNLDIPAMKFLNIANEGKTFQLKLARSVVKDKELDLSLIDSMAKNWEEGIQLLSKYK